MDWTGDFIDVWVGYLKIAYRTTISTNMSVTGIDREASELDENVVAFQKNQITAIRVRANSENSPIEAIQPTYVILATGIQGLYKLTKDFSLDIPLITQQQDGYRESSAAVHILLKEMPEAVTMREGVYYALANSPWAVLARLVRRKNGDKNLANEIVCTLSNLESFGSLVKKRLMDCEIAEIAHEIVWWLGVKPQNIRKVYPGFGFVPQKSSMVLYAPPRYRIAQNNLTQYSNLFLAGNYTDTQQPACTMEKACESAKRCVNEILKRDGKEYDQSRFTHKGV
jgi:hypothetical protein